MKLTFTCPEKYRSFETEDFSLCDNHGVTTDNRGKKVLDATVQLNAPCPYCQKIHRYKVDELACPFESSPNCFNL
ncbi:MAG: hypothetical protein EHM86_04580 [Desulfobulbaceae bacterium]|nr:MAG: hypothetical protein EHM86_04580 [Desulfobulbaceae bacterium]